jgi:hypothetical protein
MKVCAFGNRTVGAKRGAPLAPFGQVLCDQPLVRKLNSLIFFGVKVPQPRAIREVLAVVERAKRDFAGDGLIEAAEPAAVFGGIRSPVNSRQRMPFQRKSRKSLRALVRMAISISHQWDRFDARRVLSLYPILHCRP